MVARRRAPTRRTCARRRYPAPGARLLASRRGASWSGLRHVAPAADADTAPSRTRSHLHSPRRWPGSSQVFAPRDREFFDLFEEAAAQRRARRPTCSTRCSSAGPSRSELARDIVICEQEGDRITHDIIQRLNSTFVTPIDREDILELASALDDIIDFIEEVADYLGLYRIEAPMEQAQRLAHILLQATPPDRRGDAAPARLPGHPPLHGRDQPARERRRPLVREAIASLFDGGIDPMVVIRWKDIFERLEEAIDATRARRRTSLEGIVIKNQLGHVMDSDVVLVHRRRDRAGVRLHQRVPRHRQRDRDVDLDARDVAARRGRPWRPS